MKKCPKCNGRLLRIVYGLPTDKALKEAKEKGLYYAGCVVDKYTYHCEECDMEFTKDLKVSREGDKSVLEDEEIESA